MGPAASYGRSKLRARCASAAAARSSSAAGCAIGCSIADVDVEHGSRRSEELDMEVFGIPAGRSAGDCSRRSARSSRSARVFPSTRSATIDVGLPRRESKSRPRAQRLHRRRRSVDDDRRGRAAPRLHGQRDLVGSADRGILRSVRRPRTISTRRILKAVDPRDVRRRQPARAARGSVRRAVRDDARRTHEGAVPIDPPRRSAAGAHLGRDREAAASRASGRQSGSRSRWSSASSISCFRS